MVFRLCQSGARKNHADGLKWGTSGRITVSYTHLDVYKRQVCFTGIIGNLCAPLMIRLFRVREPLAAGLGIGACSHAMGTAKALELGETEGAMSGLAIGLCGLLLSLIHIF